MALFGNALSVPAATAALESAETRLASFEAEHAAKATALTGDLDFDSNLALRDELAVLERKIAAATDAVGQARRNFSAAQQAEAEAENERAHKAAEKSARAAEKLTLEVAAAAEKLAGLLTELEASREAIDAANANRGSRAFIVDGEARVREVPEKVYPTVYEEMDVWRDASGRKPTEFRVLPNGDHVPKDGGYTKHREKFVSRNEWTRPAQIPGGRFKDSIRLIGLKGEALFPAR